MSSPQPTRFPTSREVFDRIRWDPRVDASHCIIGYQERLSADGTREKPFLAWNPDGDIPWHRILYFRTLQTTLWHRTDRIDNLHALPSEAPAPEAEVAAPPAQMKAPVAQRAPSFAWDGQQWAEASGGGGDLQAPLPRLRVVSWNVLFDHHGLASVDNGPRHAALIAALLGADADVIALQEVTQALLRKVLSDPTIRARYVSSSLPSDTAIEKHGLLILSRRPFALLVHVFSPHKRLLMAALDIGLRVVTLHFTSSRSSNDVQKRALQMDTLCQYLAADAVDTLILGDFNEPDLAQAPQLTQQGAQDLWLQCHPSEPGFTFDPQQNPLAAALSLSGRSARFDRVALRAKGWRGVGIERLGTKEGAKEGTEKGSVVISDHFGLCAELGRLARPWEGEKPTYQTALVLMPPDALWEPIQRIRRKHDRNVDRWMPHINLVYGFIQEAHFEAAMSMIEDALRAVEPFEVSLAQFGTFGHKASHTVWSKPEPASPIQRLQAVVQGLFPGFDEQQKKEHGFTPHLTVGQAKREGQAQDLLKEARDGWRPLLWLVDEVVLIARGDKTPFEVKGRVKLGSKEPPQKPSPDLTPLKPSAPQNPPKAAEITSKPTAALMQSLIADACEVVLQHQHFALHVLGSHRLGVAGTESDLDVVCAVTEGPSGEIFLQSVADHLRILGAEVRDATDALVPVIKAHLEGQSVDVQYARLPQGVDPSNLARLPWERLDEQSWRALIGCREADILLEEAQSVVSLEAFRVLLVWWRSWSAAQQITGNAWCFPGSFSWAVAVTWALERAGRKRPLKPELRELVGAVLEALAHRDSALPIGLSDEALQYKPRGQRDRWPVITSCAPCQNSARSVTASTAYVLDTTLRRAAELAARAARGDNQAWDALHTLQKPQEKTPHLRLSWDNVQARGWAEGHFTGLVVALEQEGARVRPWPARGQDRASPVSRDTASVPLYEGYQDRSVRLDVEMLPIREALKIAQDWLSSSALLAQGLSLAVGPMIPNPKGT